MFALYYCFVVSFARSNHALLFDRVSNFTSMCVSGQVIAISDRSFVNRCLVWFDMMIG